MSQRTRDLPSERIGAPAVLLAVLLPLTITLQVAGAAMQDVLVRQALVKPQYVAALGIAGGLCVLVGVVLGGIVLAQQLRRAQRSRGRLRLLVLSSGGVLNGLSIAVTAVVLARVDPATLILATKGLSPPPELETPLALAGALLIGGAAVAALAAIACWGMLPATARRRFWIGADVALLGAMGWAVTELPVQPINDEPGALALPVLRHLITTAGVLRLIVRFLPLGLNLVEALRFEPLVASRHLRSQKSGFLAAIGVLSVLAVTVSSCALTTTLSVMGGFRNDLKRKILGNNAHIVVDRQHGTIEGWEPTLRRAGETPGVIGASPYVSGEVMISSASNLATAVLRGIDLDTVANVNDLPKNLRSGKLEYLAQPERLLDLPPDLSRGFMPLMPATDVDGALTDEGSDPGATSAEQKRALEQKIADLEAFLREARKDAKADKPRDVLPGIIVGQELARSLRLYVGDEVNVVAPLGALGPSGPMPKSRPFRIAGIFYSGMYEYDMKFTYVALEQAQRFLGIGDAISGIEVKVADTEGAPAVAAALEAKLDRADLRVQDWQRLNSRLFGALALEKLAMFIALGIAILVASFCIAGTLTLMVQEKGREVAVLKAMGAADRTIVRVFVIEGGLIGVLGAGLGLFLGYMVCFAAEHFGIRMNPEVYYIERLPVHIDAGEFILTGIAAVLICLVITVYPALLASRLRPVDALRYE